jgi:hypothetical protein
METPIIPEIAMSGLELLAEVFQPTAADAIINLPLPKPPPPEEIENNDKTKKLHGEEEFEKPEQEGSGIAKATSQPQNYCHRYYQTNIPPHSYNKGRSGSGERGRR